MCASTCVDEQSDVAHCGGCNSKCTGACAAGQMHRSLIASASTGRDRDHRQLVYDVFWVDASGINQAANDGSSSMLLASSVSASSLAADDDDVYWPDGSNVDFVPIDGGTVSQQPLGSNALATEVATDYIDVYVALADGIASFPCGGGVVAERRHGRVRARTVETSPVACSIGPTTTNQLLEA